MDEIKQKIKFGYLQRSWIKLCLIFVKSFYKKVEIRGADKLLKDTPIILCANHSNALADAVLLQYTCPRLIHPLARSGLFKNPIIKPILKIWQAVPVYRRQDSQNNGQDNGTVDNHAMFNKAYEMLAENQILMIFPEGQSHSDSHIKQIKTGVSRIILGYKEKYNKLPLVIPVGMNFSQVKKFRSNVYINFGKAVDINDNYILSNEQHVKDLTETIMGSMKGLVLETEEVEELAFVKQIDRFFSLRNKANRKRSMSQKFRSHKLILSVKNSLNKIVPEKIKRIQRHLNQFNRLCSKLGINDYNLNINYNSRVIRGFVIRSLLIILVAVPLGVWGFLNSILPYLLTKLAEYLFVKSQDQVHTVKILAGTLLFSVFWLTQTYYVYEYFGLSYAILYFVLLIPSSLSALVIYHEQAQIIDNLRVFYVVLKHRNLRRFLIRKRKNIEKELASLINIARKRNKV